MSVADASMLTVPIDSKHESRDRSWLTPANLRDGAAAEIVACGDFAGISYAPLCTVRYLQQRAPRITY